MASKKGESNNKIDLKKFKPSKKVMYFTGAIFLAVIILFAIYSVQSDIVEKNEAASLAEEKAAVAAQSARIEAARIVAERAADEARRKVEVPKAPVVTQPAVINFEQYNYRYAENNVINILSSMIGNGKTAFYLPASEYINVTKGSNYGFAYAIANPNPSGENYFEYEWTADESIVKDCDVSRQAAGKWIASGFRSFGNIKKGEPNYLSIYFKFPSDADSCMAKYNLEILKDGALYDSKEVVFNII